MIIWDLFLHLLQEEDETGKKIKRCKPAGQRIPMQLWDVEDDVDGGKGMQQAAAAIGSTLSTVRSSSS